ncbi:pentatricopeptide repeat-containing protein At5g66520-like [Prosopis cineraria]|uniref:pentatricopeptide repeat-containing protein At5g66520-like n=1 Tax=Prosopis cineraria TaxID=364024 RepID=UPI00240FBB39|nr:pentatricopeptide repeat-containing protein At5g66520-like [Prosopis cineraria]
MAVSLTHSSLFNHKDITLRAHQKIPTTVLLLQMCQSLQEVKQLHAQFIVTGLLGHPLNSGRLLESYVKVSQINYAISLFESIPAPDIFAYNTAIRGLTLCNFPRDALLLYKTLLLEGQIPDTYTYTFVLKACSYLEALCEGEQVHCQIIKAGISTSTHINSSLIHMYSTVIKFPSAELVLAGFSEVETPALNSMISGYLRHGHVQKARDLFDKMESRDVASWNAMISGYTKNGLHAEALEVFQEMMTSQDVPIDPDESTLVSSLSAIAHLGTMDQGRWVHTYIKRKGFKISNTLGSALIDMYAKCGCIESAYEVFEKIPERDIVTWGVIISGFAMHVQVQKCFDLFHEMILEGTQPNEVIFVSLLSACSHAGYVDMGYHYFNKMVHDFRIKPSVEHYGCMVDLLGRAGKLAEAELFIDSMPEKPNSVIWGTFLNACRMHNDARRGKKALRHLMDLEPDCGDRYKLAGIMFANAGDEEDAHKVRKFMNDFNLKATSGLSSVEVEGELHEFVAGDTGHDEVREIYTVWDGLTDY